MFNAEAIVASRGIFYVYKIMESSDGGHPTRTYGVGGNNILSADEAAQLLEVAKREGKKCVKWAVCFDDPPDENSLAGGLLVAGVLKAVGYSGVYYASGNRGAEEIADHLSEYRGVTDIGAPYYLELNEETGVWDYVM